MFILYGRGTDGISSRFILARSAFSRLQSCLWSRPEISLREKGRVYHATVWSILLYSWETLPVRVADEMMLEVFDNGSIRRILHVRRRDCVSPVELRRRLCLTSIPVLFVQRRPAGLVMLQDVPKVSWSRTYFCPNRLACGPGELEARWRRIQPRWRQIWNPPPDLKSSAMHDGERTGWKSLVSSPKTL